MEFDKQELIFNNENDRIMCDGFKINNILLNSNNPAFITFNSSKNNNNLQDNKVSSLFNDLAVPMGLLYIQEKMKNPLYKETIHSSIDDSLYDKLLNLAQRKSKSKTRKRIKINLKKGTKQRTSKLKK
tara:strand:+ start:1746 stop:2129 length:384 start_codon:yes stop_codon:yes gene_type:complete